jgi:hypothetical protein
VALSLLGGSWVASLLVSSSSRRKEIAAETTKTGVHGGTSQSQELFLDFSLLLFFFKFPSSQNFPKFHLDSPS